MTKLSRTFTIQKILSPLDFSTSMIQLTTIPSNYLVIGVDVKIDTGFNNSAKISIGNFNEKEKFLVKDSINLTLNTRYIINIIKKLTVSENIYLHLEGNPTQGEGSLTFYYITSALYKEKYFTFNDFQSGKINIGEIEERVRGYNVYIENVSVFNEGYVSVGRDNNTTLLTPLLDMSISGNYLIPTYSEILKGEEINLYFQGNPIQGEGNLIFYYFNR